MARVRIAKCWSLVRFLAEDENVPYYPCLEEMAHPLLKQIAEPIEDDDDILFFISSLLKKKKQSSQLFREIVTYLPLVHERNGYIMGPLLETLCLYTLYNNEWTE